MSRLTSSNRLLVAIAALVSTLGQAANQIPAQIPTQTPGQAPAANPLDQLRDIHLPEAITPFPWAAGWWILLALLVLVAGYYLYRVYRYQRAIALLKPAKIEIGKLRSIKKDQLNAHSIATLSALLKRICLIYFPKKAVASLSGEQWLIFLNQQASTKQAPTKQSTPLSTTPFFSTTEINFFAQTCYQANTPVEPNDWQQLLTSSEKCIESIIRTAAKNKTRPLTDQTGQVSNSLNDDGLNNDDLNNNGLNNKGFNNDNFNNRAINGSKGRGGRR